MGNYLFLSISVKYTVKQKQVYTGVCYCLVNAVAVNLNRGIFLIEENTFVERI